MKGIKERIQFGLDNGFDGGDRFEINRIDSRHFGKSYFEYQIVFFKGKNGKLDKCYSVFEGKTLFMKKEFIEAIARGRIKEGYGVVTVNPGKDWGDAQHNMENWITTKQSFAIRDDNLIEYINNILPN